MLPNEVSPRPGAANAIWAGGAHLQHHEEAGMPERTQTQQPPPTPAPCRTCHGQQGAVVDTSTNVRGVTITRQTWHSCTTCHGTGHA